MPDRRDSLTRLDPLENGVSSGFDVSSDGQRFLVVYPEIIANELPVTVIANWIAEAPR